MIECKDKAVFARGKRGIISTATWKGKKVAIKEKNPRSTAIHRIRHEGNMLVLLNSHKIGPRLLASDELQLVYLFVEGEPIEAYLARADRKHIIRVLAAVYDQCRTMDLLHINKLEMTNPFKHILVTREHDPVLIDFERAKRSLRPRNVTQFAQYLMSRKIGRLLQEKGITLTKEDLIRACESYSRDPTARHFGAVKERSGMGRP
ncbi:MAG: hypothetical protein GXP63_02940 [DPANN group archaeon]|nr:hypothetical protein [DPANN group archaeon]